MARHASLDAALLRLEEPVGSERLPLPDTIEDYRGRKATLHVVDPHSHHAMPLPDTPTIGGYDHEHLEYVLYPETAHGYSGGLLAVGDRQVGLLNRRAIGEPLARAIALAKLRSWIAHAIDTPRGEDAQADPGYDALLALLGERALHLLADRGIADLRRRAGFPQGAADLIGRGPGERFRRLVVALHQATQACLPDWRTQAGGLPAHIKAGCLGLLGELIKLAVDRQGRAPDRLAEIAAATPDRMFVACARTGTAAAVYCALADIPLCLTERKSNDYDLGGGSVIDLDGLAQGVGADAEQDAYRAAWLAVKPEAAPPDLRSEDHLRTLIDAIDMEYTDFRHDPWILATRGPREWLHGSGLASASERLRIGLVIHQADSDYAYLAVDEPRLVNLVCKYLQLLESA